MVQSSGFSLYNPPHSSTSLSCCLVKSQKSFIALWKTDFSCYVLYCMCIHKENIACLHPLSLSALSLWLSTPKGSRLAVLLTYPPSICKTAVAHLETILTTHSCCTIGSGWVLGLSSKLDLFSHSNIRLKTVAYSCWIVTVLLVNLSPQRCGNSVDKGLMCKSQTTTARWLQSQPRIVGSNTVRKNKMWQGKETCRGRAALFLHKHHL